MNARNRSQELYRASLQHIPGGVNSPVRAFKSVGGTPVFMQSAKGSILTDVDGNEYIDYISSWGPMILGHANPKVVEAITEQIKDSTSFGAPTEKEFLLAGLIKKMVPGLEKIRMVNSGTEACMSAVRLARGYTGKSKIIKFEGCYHGHADSFLIKAGSGASTFGEPDSPGVTPGTAGDTLTAAFNNLDEVKELVEKNKDEIAAIILEPVVGNMGCVLPNQGFLQGLRDLCTKNNIVFIFDEVMTGFRLAPGGAQELFGIQADLVTYGKIIGGGMPVGAFGGKAEIMDKLSPAGPVYQAGTLSGNPMAMTAGLATLRQLYENPEIYSELSKKTDYLAQGLSNAISKKSIAHRINKIGSMITVFFTDVEITNFETSATANNESFKKFFHCMLDEGIYLPPSSFESWFLSNTLTYEMLDKTIAAAQKAVSEF